MPKIVATKADWIKLGFRLFSESGELGLNVEKMSRLLRCNKSSFYWHFKSKKEFIDELIDFWILKDTSKIIEEVNIQASPKEKLLKLIAISFKKDANLDFVFYLKKYAIANNAVSKLIDTIDSQRLLYVQDLLIELGYSKQDALSKTRIFYNYLIGYHEMIRYKKQRRGYLSNVLLDINHFIKIN